jgi:uncharacterized small protein (DUF1192 family)
MANELERRDEWRDGVLDKITTVGYILGQHDGEALVNTAKRVTDEIERLRAEINSAKPDPCKDGSCSCCWVDEPSEIEQLRAELAACRDRLDWVAEKFFERKWDGTINRPCNWYLRGDYRHTAHKMKGDTFDAAIDSARKGEA